MTYQPITPYNLTPSVLIGTDTAAQVRAALSVYDTATIDDMIAAIELTPGEKGDDGASAYEVAVSGGFVGTETQWLASLKGEPGQDGIGTDGEDGYSAYQIAVIDGFIGTEAEWLESLHGQDGTNGTNGAAGPNTVTAATSTNLTGILTGNGAIVGSTASLSIAQGGTGGTTQATAQTALGVDSSATVSSKASTAAATTLHNDVYYTKVEMNTGELTMSNKTLSNYTFPNDMSFDQSLYTKNQLCHCPLKSGGDVTMTVDGSPFILLEAFKLALVDGKNSYINLAITEAPTTVEVIFDNGTIFDIYGEITWQPVFSMRSWFSNTFQTRPNSIQVLVSSNGTDWAEPINGAWTNNNLLALGATNFWKGFNANPRISGVSMHTIRYVKFVLTDWFYNETYAYKNFIWFMQFCLRKNESPALPQFVDKSGDTFLGDMRFNAGLLDQNGSKGTLDQVPKSTGSGFIWADESSGGVPTAAPYFMEVALSYGDEDVTAGAKKELIYVHTSANITSIVLVCDPENKPINDDITVDLNDVDPGTGAATSVLSAVATIATETASGIGTVNGTQFVPEGTLLSLDVDSGSDGKRLRAIIKFTPVT